MNIKKNYWLFFIFPLIFICIYFFKWKEEKPLRQLPYYGPKSWKASKDTVYHQIPDFEFTNQWNKKFSSRDSKGKIYVCEYFFTSCKSICPIMNHNLERVYKAFETDKNFLILSHTVDPENDSAFVLMNYAKMHGVTTEQWQFLTGSKKDLYNLARKGYLLNAEEGNGGEEDFIHTQNFALIDWNKHIRGYYDGTDSLEINRMILEIKLLIHEHDYTKRNNL